MIWISCACKSQCALSPRGPRSSLSVCSHVREWTISACSMPVSCLVMPCVFHTSQVCRSHVPSLCSVFTFECESGFLGGPVVKALVTPQHPSASRGPQAWMPGPGTRQRAGSTSGRHGVSVAERAPPGGVRAIIGYLPGNPKQNLPPANEMYRNKGCMRVTSGYIVPLRASGSRRTYSEENISGNPKKRITPFPCL